MLVSIAPTVYQFPNLPGNAFRFQLTAFPQADVLSIDLQNMNQGPPRGFFVILALFVADGIALHEFFKKGIGELNDLGARAEVSVQGNMLARNCDILPGFSKYLHFCAPEAVDGLFGIAHDKQLRALTAQPLDDLHLHRVCVLELVHHDVAEVIVPHHVGIFKKLRCGEF